MPITIRPSVNEASLLINIPAASLSKRTFPSCSSSNFFLCEILPFSLIFRSILKFSIHRSSWWILIDRFVDIHRRSHSAQQYSSTHTLRYVAITRKSASSPASAGHVTRNIHQRSVGVGRHPPLSTTRISQRKLTQKKGKMRDEWTGSLGGKHGHPQQWPSTSKLSSRFRSAFDLLRATCGGDGLHRPSNRLHRQVH